MISQCSSRLASVPWDPELELERGMPDSVSLEHCPDGSSCPVGLFESLHVDDHMRLEGAALLVELPQVNVVHVLDTFDIEHLAEQGMQVEISRRSEREDPCLLYTSPSPRDPE